MPPAELDALKTHKRGLGSWIVRVGGGIEDAAFPPGVRAALEENRMLILEMRDVSGNLAAAEARNRFVIEHADALFTPYIARDGMLDRMLNECAKADGA